MHVCGFGEVKVRGDSLLILLFPFLILQLSFLLLLLLLVPSLGLLVGLRRSVILRQRHALVTVPQLVELSGLVLTAAGAAVPETGQWRSHLHTLDRHRAFDGLTELREQREWLPAGTYSTESGPSLSSDHSLMTISFNLLISPN